METLPMSTMMKDTDSSLRFSNELFVQDIIRSLQAGTRPEKRNAAEQFVGRCSDASPFVDTLDPSVRLELLKLFVSCGRVLTMPFGNDRDLERGDFGDGPEISVLSLKCLNFILADWESDAPAIDILADVVILCAQHIEQNLWTSQESNTLAQALLSRLLKIMNCSAVNDAFNNKTDESFRKNLFVKFPISLTRDSWKLDPGMTAAFKWCLLQTKHPFVGDVFNEVLPISLLFIDDFVVENRTSGLQCLLHIMHNSPTASMQWYGRADVIYNALKNIIFTREPQVIVCLYPCLFRVLQILLPDPKKPTEIRKVTHYDTIYQDFLRGMEAEQVIAIRQAYSQHLVAFIDILGITVVRHLQSTLKVILQYVEIYDGPEEITRLNILQALKAIITVAWPRIAKHLHGIIEGIVKLMYDVPGLESHRHCKDAIVVQCIECLKLLRILCPTEIDELCEPIKELAQDIPQLLSIKEIWLE